MPIKEIMHTYECKYCHKKFTMFDKPDGGLIFFPENVMWPCNGELELVMHIKSKHKNEYRLADIFYSDQSLIALNYHIDPEVAS